MPVRAGRHVLGPAGATLQVRTYRQGMASKVGHDLVLELTRWEAIVVSGEGDPGLGIELTADPTSLEVKQGLRGAKPLSDSDRANIVRRIDDQVLGGKPIELRSTGTQLDGDGRRLAIRGDLTLAGRTRPVELELDVGSDGHVAGGVRLTQSEWGIEPYSAMMGALKVSDEVDVVVDAHLPVG